MQSPDIKSAKILENYKIHLVFENGENKIFDLIPYLKAPVFKPLLDKNELYSFSIVDGTIEWKCGADLSQNTFYIASKPAKQGAIV